MDSVQVFHQASRLIKKFETRDPLEICDGLKIRVYTVPLNDLLGMYTFQWNHKIILLNDRMDDDLQRMVTGHELGHAVRHTAYAKSDGLREFSLFNMKDILEYEANAFCSHLLMSSEEIYDLCMQGYDVIRIASEMHTNVNLVLIKLQEMSKLGYNLTAPLSPESAFFKHIKGSSLPGI